MKQITLAGLFVALIMVSGTKAHAYSFTCDPNSHKPDAHYFPDNPECKWPCAPMYHPIEDDFERNHGAEGAVCAPDCTGVFYVCQKDDGSWTCCRGSNR